MDALKKYAKYIILIVAIYLFTSFLVFIGFNSSYKEIQLKNELPTQISIEKAEATKQQARIYGYIKSEEENSLNGKYIKISVFDANNEKIAIEYLKIENLKSNEQKLFRANVIAENSKGYEISIVDNNE